MGTPGTLLMVRKSEMKDFFENNKVHDNKTTFLATYDSNSNSYSFSKLNRLISYIFSEIRTEIERERQNGIIGKTSIKTGTNYYLYL